jgi:L-aspartate oxidase
MDVVETDVLVVGSGLAGLFAALTAAREKRVLLATRGSLLASNSYWAQGGVAAAVDPSDTPTLHAADTLEVGGGLNDGQAVRVLAEEAPARIADLVALGVRFDGDAQGPHLGLEGGHRRRRILHAGGSATGSRLVGVLAEQVRAHPAITLCEETTVCTLLAEGQRCHGAVLYHEPSRTAWYVRAPATILATGGACGLYERTTNPPAARGAGVALAYAAGAAVAGMEFVQFHPTALALAGQRAFLLSEALRGEGAHLLDERGRRFMVERHALAELAPRDVVARAMVEEMRRAGGDHVFLSLRHLEPRGLHERFPNIAAHLREAGLDFTHDLLPVAPAAHYMMGGVVTDTWGATAVRGLFACGEVASTGVHGANRLASNSLLECLVYGHRAARAALALSDAGKALSPPLGPPTGRQDKWPVPPGEPTASDLRRLGHLLMEDVGLVRDEQGLERARARLAAWAPLASPPLRPALLVAGLIAQAALLRTESRGAHLRTDFPALDPAWTAQIVLQNGVAPRVEPLLSTAVATDGAPGERSAHGREAARGAA